jgi:FdhD protein
VHVPVTVLRSDGSRDEDRIVLEEPLEIRVGDRVASVTLRTPGDDFDLAAGLLFTESIVAQTDDVADIRHWGSPNVVRVDLRHGAVADLSRARRNFASTSSCGLCGKTSIETLLAHAPAIQSEVIVARETIDRLPAALQNEQKAFAVTGGLHAAAIFSIDGALLRVREDIGRHNAADKVIGSYVRERVALGEHILFLTSRTSFEIVQKAVVARIPVVASVGAPSSMAVALAREAGLTLLGFVRDGRFNVYSGEERLK